MKNYRGLYGLIQLSDSHHSSTHTKLAITCTTNSYGGMFIIVRIQLPFV